MKTRWGQLAAENAGRAAAMIPVDLQAASVRPDDVLATTRFADGRHRPERRRVLTVLHGAHYIELRTIRLRGKGGHWFPDGDLQATTLAPHDRLNVYPKGRS